MLALSDGVAYARTVLENAPAESFGAFNRSLILAVLIEAVGRANEEIGRVKREVGLE